MVVGGLYLLYSFGLSKEVQVRMINKAVEQLGINHEIYESPVAADTADKRSELLGNCRGNEVVVVARLNVLGRPWAEVKKPLSVSKDFMLFVSALRHKCGYVLVLDDNLPETPPNSSVISNDKDWDDVFARAVNIVSNARSKTPKEAKAMAREGWKGRPRGVRGRPSGRICWGRPSAFHE